MDEVRICNETRWRPQRQSSHQISEMRLRIRMRPDVVDEVGFARLERRIGQPPPEQFVAQPDPIRIHDIAFAIIGDLADLSFLVEFLDLRAMDAGRLAGQTHDPAQLVQRRLALRAERGQDVAKIDGVFRVPIEIEP
jgi:hypothetical protein